MPLAGGEPARLRSSVERRDPDRAPVVVRVPVDLGDRVRDATAVGRDTGIAGAYELVDVVRLHTGHGRGLYATNDNWCKALPVSEREDERDRGRRSRAEREGDEQCERHAGRIPGSPAAKQPFILNGRRGCGGTGRRGGFRSR